MIESIPGFVSSDGTVYGPPAEAVAWARPGCPIVPARIREHLESVQVPTEVSRLFGMTLTYDQLDSEILEQSNLDDLSGEGRNIIRDTVSAMSGLLSNETLIPAGIPLTWLQALPIRPTTMRAIEAICDSWLKDDELVRRPVSVGDFVRMRGVGVTMSIEVLCVMESAERGRLTDVDVAKIEEGEAEFDRVAFEWAVEQACRRRMKTLAPLVEPMQLLAGWAQSETNAESVGEAIHKAMARSESVQEWNAIAGIRLASLSSPLPHPYAILDSWSEGLDNRETVILRHRIRGDEPLTFRELARRFGVSPERTRQLEGRVQRKLRRFLAEEDARPILWRASTLRHLLGAAAPCGLAENLLEAPPGNNDYRTILLGVAGPYVLDGQWLVRRTSQTDDPTHGILLGADGFGRIDLEAARLELSAWGLDASLHRDWLTRHSGIREFNGELVRWGRTVGDRLAFALADIDRPATIDELMAHIQEDRSRDYALKALASDPRVAKADEDRYALRSWELKKFNSVAGPSASTLLK